MIAAVPNRSAQPRKGGILALLYRTATAFLPARIEEIIKTGVQFVTERDVRHMNNLEKTLSAIN
jgi:hypothetical protein